MNKYRHEIKFLVTQREYDLLRHRLKHILETDPNYASERYHVSSIYFDDVKERGMYDKLDGVVESTVGYTGGDLKNPTYYQVSSGKTGHAEVLQLKFNPEIISYKDLLDYFWRLHDPTEKDKQGPDVGNQYRSVIFYHSVEQKKIADKEKSVLIRIINIEMCSRTKFYFNGGFSF